MAVLGCAVLAGLVAAFAEPAPPTPAPSSAAAPSAEAVARPGASPSGVTDFNLRVTAQTLRYDDGRHFLTLDGNVVFTHLDTQITSPHAEFQTDKQVGTFTRGVRITQPGTTITADRLSAFYADRKAILTGHVNVVTEKLQSGEKSPAGASSSPSAAPRRGPAATVPTIMLCNELDYWWEKQEGDAIGDVKIRQGDRRAFSDRAHYTGGEVREVHMYSNVRYERGPNDWMTCEDAVIDMDTNVFTGNGNVEAYVKLQSTPAPAAAPTTPAGDRILRPAPPMAPAARRVPSDLPATAPTVSASPRAATSPTESP